MNAIDEAIALFGGEEEKTAMVGQAVGGLLGEGLGRLGKQTGQALAGGLAGAAAGALVGGLGDAVGHLHDAATKARDYRAMIAQHPHLEQENPAAVQSAFTTLRRFAPEFSKDPLIAGSYVTKIVANSDNAATLMEGAMGALKNQPRALSREYAQHGVGAGLKYKDPKEVMRSDLSHQQALADMQHGLRMHEMDAQQGFQEWHENEKNQNRFSDAIQLEGMRHAIGKDDNEALERAEQLTPNRAPSPRPRPVPFKRG